mgnify:CR=1 FL=1
MVKLAMSKSSTDLVLDLLQQGHYPNEQDAQGLTSLHWAAKTGNDKLVEALLAAKADVNIPDQQENTPLYYAVLRHRADVVRKLLDAGADPNAPRHNGTTPLHIAARQNYFDVIRVLLQYGANCNLQNEAGETALHLTVENGSKDIVNALLEAGADPCIMISNGDTALHLLATAIVRNRNPVNLDSRIDIMVELLQSYYACDVINHRGHTPLDIIGEEFTRSHSLDMVVIVKTFLEMKIKQSEETFQQILFGIGRRQKHYPNTLPTMLPYIDPKQLIVMSVKPLEIEMKGFSFSFFVTPPAASALKLLHKDYANRGQQFARMTRMLCEVGCQPPALEKVEEIKTDDPDLTPSEQLYIRDALKVWTDFIQQGPSLQTLARNCVRRSMVNLRQDTFCALPIPPRLRNYVAMTDLRNLEY